MECSSCQSAFNQDKCLPKLLPRCGHSLCLECIKANMKSDHIDCLQCGTMNFCSDVDKLPTNQAILSILTSRGRGSAFCRVHNKMAEGSIS